MRPDIRWGRIEDVYPPVLFTGRYRYLPCIINIFVRICIFTLYLLNNFFSLFKINNWIFNVFNYQVISDHSSKKATGTGTNLTGFLSTGYPAAFSLFSGIQSETDMKTDRIIQLTPRWGGTGLTCLMWTSWVFITSQSIFIMAILPGAARWESDREKI